MISCLLSVDPGKKYSGVAFFRDGVLVAADRPWPGRNSQLPDVELLLGTVAAVIEWGDQLEPAGYDVAAEWMEMRGRRSPTTYTLPPLWGVGASVAAIAKSRGFEGQLLPVSTWKGPLPKKKHHPMILAALTPAEVAVVVEATGQTLEALIAVQSADASDVVDAVGIGLVALGRDPRKKA